MRLLVSCTLLLVALSVRAETQVVVQPLSELTIQTLRSAPAQVVNDEHATLSAQISARVDQVLVLPGTAVEAGQPLLKLDCRDYRLAQQQANSNLSALQVQARLARQQLSRAEKLLKQKNTSIELRDQRRTELQSLQAQMQGAAARVEESELAIERCEPRAPFSGVITARMVSSGNLVTPGMPLLQLLAEGTQEVTAELTLQQAERLQQAEAVYYRLADTRYPLSLRALIPLIDGQARTQQVRLSFSDTYALSGSSGRIEWQDRQGRLPARYIVSRDGVLGLMRVVDNKADFVALPDAIEGQAVAVKLPADSQIIIEGQYAVQAGDPVVLAGQE
jgi:RND family efflux transporter MFP subunit